MQSTGRDGGAGSENDDSQEMARQANRQLIKINYEQIAPIKKMRNRPGRFSKSSNLVCEI